MIPISKVVITEEQEQLVLEVLRSGNIAQGPMVAKLEEIASKKIGVGNSIAVNNGTTSLIASLKSLDLQPGDQVITSPFTFAASLNAIIDAGAVALFADINEEDFGMNHSSLSENLTNNTRVVMPVHLYGQMCDMESISHIASKNDLRILEDSAQAFGASQNGVMAGTRDIGSFSFYATKNITTGEGGLITTNDNSLAEKIRTIRNQGMKKKYEYEIAGNNYRLTDIQAALGIPQINNYDLNVERRSNNANLLTQGLEDLPGIVLPKVQPGRTHVWHQYTIRVTSESPISRNELAEHLTRAGVGTGIYYPKMVFDYEIYNSHPQVKSSENPIAKKISSEVLSLPVHPHLSLSDLEKIIETVRDIVLKK